MYDPNICLDCGLLFKLVEWPEELSGIGEDDTYWVTVVDDEVCQCAAEDDDN
ncbi:hypothetical protein [Pseudomonas simiae]|uniref:hypothetical protein n=1 Tax=Pseudomonas simiae TaxID=321846 RepID=UPI003D6AF553